MAFASGQPEVRFNKAGPYSFEGVAFVPKVIAVTRTITTAETGINIWAAPAGTFIARAIGVCISASGNSTTGVALGQDGATESLIKATELSMETVGNMKQFSSGLYLATDDNVTITVAGTAAASSVYVLIEYFDTVAMRARGTHIAV
ncbi:hypothetical protein MUP59_10905 [Candidatus Bathyarchaeota archaeon]|nr:hypothetical protein [Candidatus Bathyarchaeota archaeon]